METTGLATNVTLGWECDSGLEVEHLPRLFKALGLIPSVAMTLVWLAVHTEEAEAGRLGMWFSSTTFKINLRNQHGEKRKREGKRKYHIIC